MKRSTALLCFSFASALVAALFCLQPTLLNGLVQIFDASEDANRLESELRRSADLLRRDGVALRRIAAKEEIIVDLIEGRLTLLQAARWFKELDEKPADCQDDYRRRFRGRSDEEK